MTSGSGFMQSPPKDCNRASKSLLMFQTTQDLICMPTHLYNLVEAKKGNANLKMEEDI